jgi:predicted nucleic-acid-binding Zn-ribbon protein
MCKKHSEFLQQPSVHLRGSCCPKCSVNNYSKSSIKYLNFMEKMYNVQIQHAENVGEHSIKTTIYSADGYCEETNTIYEFHGDFWHGNPKLYNPISINKRNDKTFGELYQTTLEREQQIKVLGYNLVIMWEHDWNKINKSIRVLQRKFKSLH